MAEYGSDMLVWAVLSFSQEQQKRTPVISGHALIDTINEDNKPGEGGLSGRCSDIPGRMG